MYDEREARMAVKVFDSCTDTENGIHKITLNDGLLFSGFGNSLYCDFKNCGDTPYHETKATGIKGTIDRRNLALYYSEFLDFYYLVSIGDFVIPDDSFIDYGECIAKEGIVLLFFVDGGNLGYEIDMRFMDNYTEAKIFSSTHTDKEKISAGMFYHPKYNPPMTEQDYLITMREHCSHDCDNKRNHVEYVELLQSLVLKDVFGNRIVINPYTGKKKQYNFEQWMKMTKHLWCHYPTIKRNPSEEESTESPSEDRLECPSGQSKKRVKRCLVETVEENKQSRFVDKPQCPIVKFHKGVNPYPCPIKKD